MSSSRSRIRSLTRLGFTVVRKNKHIVMRSPDGRILILASTEGRGRAEQNLRAQIRRMGYDLSGAKVGGGNGHL